MHVFTQCPQGGVAIDKLAFGVDKKRAVRVAVKRNTDISTRGDNLLLERFNVERPAITIDITTVRLVIDGHNARSQLLEQMRSKC